MKKAIILTYPNLTKEEHKLLKETKIFKIACNAHSEDLKPDKRLIADRGIIDSIKEKSKKPIVSCLEKREDVEDCTHFPHRFSTLLSCVDYLIYNGYTDVLLIADNTKANNSESPKQFQEHNRTIINKQSKFINIYKYSECGVFDIPHLTIKEFLIMVKRKKQTMEDIILGIKPEEKVEMLVKDCIFTESFLFEIHTKGLDNKSVENGELIRGFLPAIIQQKLLDGAKQVEYNGLVIKRLTGK